MKVAKRTFWPVHSAAMLLIIAWVSCIGACADVLGADFGPYAVNSGGASPDGSAGSAGVDAATTGGNGSGGSGGDAANGGLGGTGQAGDGSGGAAGSTACDAWVSGAVAGPGGQSCYYFVGVNPLFWSAAKAACEDLGGHLATVQTAEENTFVKSLHPTTTAWLGATDGRACADPAVGPYDAWITGEAFSLPAWFLGEPNGSGSASLCYEHCVEQRGDTEAWNDVRCETTKGYVCEREIAGCPLSADCAALKTTLVHRYSFDGSGLTAIDSVGSANGTLVGGASLVTINGRGTVSLSGTDQYVDLPNGVLSALQSATIEAWVTWNGGAPFQRIFDFGTSGGAEDTQGSGSASMRYVFLTPSSGVGVLRAAFTTSGQTGELGVSAVQALPTAARQHVVVVVHPQADTLALYLNGMFQAETALAEPLSGLQDVNNWLGRSQFATDPEFSGTIHEFRIYDTALSAQLIKLSSGLGPDPAFLDQ
jgi:hypothetical protein